jgi:hypothetical protein
MHNALKIILFALGLILGYFLFSKDAETITKTITETKTDTIFITIRDTIRIKSTEIKHEVIRDTVLIDFKPQIKAFKASKPFLYGNISINGNVLGEVLKMDISHDFKLPQVTNTITTTNTVIKKPAGLFITAGIGVNNSPFVGAIFVKDRYLIGVNTSGFQAGYKLISK